MGLFLRRLLELPSALAILVYTAAQFAEGSLLEDRSNSNNNTNRVPAPLSINPDQNWDGIDGAWSSFTLRVGTPEQNVRTFVSTASYQTWVVLPQGCEAAGSPDLCANSRGWIFDANSSSTFDRVGIYDLWIEKNLGYTGNAVYGYDTVGLGGQGEGGPTLLNTTVGTFAVESFYLGVFGVNPKPTNFTDFSTQSPSYMSLLKEENYIPSVSFGHTAGASYRGTGVLASLTLGGYDSSRFVENDVTWTLAVDNDRDIVVALQSISTPSMIESSPVATKLLPKPIYVYIDSTIPHIWLPVEACEQFETEFGLVYDKDTNLYLVNNTLHESLLDRDANVTFSLGESLSGGPTVQITLPYAAFDLTAKPPYQGLSNHSLYFPLQRAQNDTQYTLGRTFLQEAYLSVNWETAKFNVSQVSWDASAEENLVAMLPLRESSGDSSFRSHLADEASSGSMSTGAIAGAAVGGVLAAAALAGLLVWWCLRRKKREGQIQVLDDEKPETRRSSLTRLSGLGGFSRQPAVFPKAELDGSPNVQKGLLSNHGSMISGQSSPVRGNLNGYYGMPSPTTPSAGNGTYSSTQSGGLFSPISAIAASEADSRELQIYEMPGDMPMIGEKDGKTLSEKEAIAHREKIYNGVEPPAPDSAIDNTEESFREHRRIFRPEEVVEMNVPVEPRDLTVRRAFSFELDDSERGTYL